MDTGSSLSQRVIRNNFKAFTFKNLPFMTLFKEGNRLMVPLFLLSKTHVILTINNLHDSIYYLEDSSLHSIFKYPRLLRVHRHSHPRPQHKLRWRPHRLPSLNQEIVGIVHTKVKNCCFDPIVMLMRESWLNRGWSNLDRVLDRVNWATLVTL